MRCHPACHGPCGAHRGRVLIGGGSQHEQQADAYVPRMFRAHVHVRDEGGELAEEEGQGREVQEFLRARLLSTFST